jgi:DNA polymerase-3 subunit delta'
VEQAGPAYLPWQAPLLSRALDLKARGRLPQAVIIDDDSRQDSGGFVHYLASLLLCDQPRELTPCGACDACRMMQAGTYADYALITLEIDEKTKKLSKNIKIEQIRKLIHEVSLTHQYARLKIAAIYPAEHLSRGGANAFLKTLEEPAPGVLLMLVTHNRGRIPITLRSRCQTWRLGLPQRAEARDWLQQQGLTAGDADTYLDYAGGDPVLALDLQQSDYASLVADFKQRLGNFLRGSLAASSLCQHLKSFDTALLRRLIDMTLNAYCYRSSGVDAAGNPLEDGDRERAQRLLELRQRAQNQLQVEENNLDLQLQLEDVLISLKQILTRRTI